MLEYSYPIWRRRDATLSRIALTGYSVVGWYCSHSGALSGTAKQRADHLHMRSGPLISNVVLEVSSDLELQPPAVPKQPAALPPMCERPEQVAVPM